MSDDKPKFRNQQLVTVRVGDILDNELNFRTHGDEQKQTFEAVVEAIGWYGYPDVYRTESGALKLVDGELRKKHLINAYGEDACIAVNEIDFTRDEARYALGTKDNLSAMAIGTTDKLKQLLEGRDDDGQLAKLMDSLASEYRVEFDSDDLALDVEDTDDLAQESGTGGEDTELATDGDGADIELVNLMLTAATSQEYDKIIRDYEEQGSQAGEVINASSVVLSALEKQVAEWEV